MKDALIKYLVTITNGDSYVPTGTEYIVGEQCIESILKNGYAEHIHTSDPSFTNYYPCSIKKLVYKLETTENYGRSFNNDIKTHYSKPNYDWTDHWC